MTKKELIKALEKFDDDAEIVIDVKDGSTADVEEVDEFCGTVYVRITDPNW